MNRSALAYWKMNGYTDEEIISVCRELDENIMAARIVFRGNGEVEGTLTKATWAKQQGHYGTITILFQQLGRTGICRNLKGSLLVWLEDGMWRDYERYAERVPILAFGRRREDRYTILMPDPAFIGELGYTKEREKMEELAVTIPWEQRQQTLIWRGAATGVYLMEPQWKDVGRVRLARLAKEMNDPRSLDAKITKCTHLPEDRRRELEDLGLVGDSWEFFDFLRYRYQIDVDGYSVAWKSLFLKLCSHSLTLKVGSDIEQWYFDSIRPWEHFIPVREDMTDLPDLVKWIRAHDAECQEICNRATAFMREITFESESVLMVRLLEQLFACQRSDTFAKLPTPTYTLN